MGGYAKEKKDFQEGGGCPFEGNGRLNATGTRWSTAAARLSPRGIPEAM